MNFRDDDGTPLVPCVRKHGDGVFALKLEVSGISNRPTLNLWFDLHGYCVIPIRNQ